jgi:CHC2 zinc finger
MCHQRIPLSSPGRNKHNAHNVRVIDARELKAKVDLVSFAKQFTKLRRVGSQVRGLCPFHAERHPSFYIHPQKQVFYCFGCNAGGDLLTFAMRAASCDFYQALRIVREFSEGVARASKPRSGLRFGASEGGDSPLSPPKAGVCDSQFSAESRALLLAAIERTDRRLEAIRKANVQAAEVLATACEPWTEAEPLLLVKNRITVHE